MKNVLKLRATIAATPTTTTTTTAATRNTNTNTNIITNKQEQQLKSLITYTRTLPTTTGTTRTKPTTETTAIASLSAAATQERSTYQLTKTHTKNNSDESKKNVNPAPRITIAGNTQLCISNVAQHVDEQYAHSDDSTCEEEQQQEQQQQKKRLCKRNISMVEANVNANAISIRRAVDTTETKTKTAPITTTTTTNQLQLTQQNLRLSVRKKQRLRRRRKRKAQFGNTTKRNNNYKYNTTTTTTIKTSASTYNSKNNNDSSFIQYWCSSYITTFCQLLKNMLQQAIKQRQRQLQHLALSGFATLLRLITAIFTSTTNNNNNNINNNTRHHHMHICSNLACIGCVSYAINTVANHIANIICRAIALPLICLQQCCSNICSLTATFIVNSCCHSGVSSSCNINNNNKKNNNINIHNNNKQHTKIDGHSNSIGSSNNSNSSSRIISNGSRSKSLTVQINGLYKHSWIFLLIYLNLYAKVCLAGYHEKRLLHDLLDPYNTLERPVLNESDPLQLSFGLTLMQIIDVDEKNQLLVTNVWLKLEWNDMNLRWNTSDYGGVKDLRIPPHRIWKPDVLMYNSADEGFDGTYQTNVVVRNNGSCLYVPPGIFKSTCKIDITWFPFDDQRCEMKFGSWTYDGFQLDLQLQDETGGDISSYVLNGEWELLGVPGKRNEIYYNCCPEPYIDITFAIIIRRRTLYYFFNLIIPCVLIASMALLGFTLPPDSGEKLSLGVTILLSLTVFLNMVAETMPATSDAVPLLGTYFNCIMFMVASSVVSTILILNYHHRNADTHEMSEWIRIVFLCWLPWILRMSRPGRPLILEFPTTPCSDTSSERKHQILSDVELKERSSKSLLANVLDIDDDFRHNCRPMTPGGTLPHNPAFYRTVYGQGDDGSIGPIGSTRMPDAVTHHTCIKSSTEYELGLILKEIRFITDQLRKEDEDNDIANDWKFAAMVVDRLCLIIFTMFTILATIAVLLSAPHIIVS